MESHSQRPTRRIRPAVLVGGFLLILASILAASFLLRTPSITSANPSNPQAVALGRTVYAANCASCHGANLQGAANWQQPLADGTLPAPPHDVTGHTWHHNDDALFTTVKYGGQAMSPAGYINRMPAFSSVLRDEEIFAVLAYIKSTWPLEVQQLQQQGHQ